MSGLLFHILADHIGLPGRAPAPLPDVEKVEKCALIEIALLLAECLSRV
jgi:hypothetical protein